MMPIKAVLFDMFDTLMLIEKNHEFYSPSIMTNVPVPQQERHRCSFEKFNAAYIEGVMSSMLRQI